MYTQDQLELKACLEDLTFIADRELYLPSFQWQEYSDEEKRFDIQHRLKHTYRERIKPEHGYNREEQIRAINFGQYYEGPKQLDTTRERELERRGGLKVTNVQFKSKAISVAWCNASRTALERRKFQELQQKKQEEIEERKKVISNQMRKKFASIMLKKKPE